jgi:hypothetical protein
METCEICKREYEPHNGAKGICLRPSCFRKIKLADKFVGNRMNHSTHFEEPSDLKLKFHKMGFRLIQKSHAKMVNNDRSELAELEGEWLEFFKQTGEPIARHYGSRMMNTSQDLTGKIPNKNIFTEITSLVLRSLKASQVKEI